MQWLSAASGTAWPQYDKNDNIKEVTTDFTLENGNKQSAAALFCLYVSTTQVENTLLCIGCHCLLSFMVRLIALRVTFLSLSVLFIPIFSIIVHRKIKQELFPHCKVAATSLFLRLILIQWIVCWREGSHGRFSLTNQTNISKRKGVWGRA